MGDTGNVDRTSGLFRIELDVVFELQDASSDSKKKLTILCTLLLNSNEKGT